VTVYRTTAHHRPTPNGYSGTTPDSFEELPDEVADLPAPGAVEHLRELGVRFVVLSGEGGPWAHLRNPDDAHPLRLLGRYDGELLYEVPRAEPRRRGAAVGDTA
jgi:hypothetical protein